jgi:predicted nucleic-acid-binding protein
MQAIDTNILARFLVRDDAAQMAVAARILGEGVFVSTTVLLETAWLLTSRYRYSRQQAAAALTTILDIDGIMTAEEGAMRWAFARFGEGADCADMLHLVTSQRADRFCTFDKDLARAAGDDAPIRVETIML